MKKIRGLLIGMFILIVFGNSLVSGLVCCEKLKNGGSWCQDATAISECDSKYSHWDKFCSMTRECTGTCIESTGKCAESTPNAICVERGGSWNENEASDIEACKEVCCLLGMEAWYVNPTECQGIFNDYGRDGEMIKGISRQECYARKVSKAVGACVISTSAERNCTIITEEECDINKHLNELKGYLANPDLVKEIDVEFWEDRLCTARINSQFISDCVPTNYTRCVENKIYYVDSCGNTANIYDTNKFYVRGNQTREDYWSFKKDYFDLTVCNVSSRGSSSCGNCDTGENTMCQSYKEANIGQPSRISNPSGLVCGDLSCEVDENGDGRIDYIKNHTESWCGDITGAKNSGIMIIHRNLTTGVISKSNITALQNTSKYNIPGSRYYKLVCSYGKVLVEECGDFRSSVCIQGTNDVSKETSAVCEFNPYLKCLAITTRTACEDNTSLCKWIPGYRWQGNNETVPENLRKEYQGSCVPLIAKGIGFWKDGSNGASLCMMSTVQEYALYETSIWSDRDNMDEWSDERLANNCYNGCYAVPYYGQEFNQKPNEQKLYPEEIPTRTGPLGIPIKIPQTDYQRLTLFYDESGYDLPSGVGSYHLSDRRGQYCHKDGRPDEWVTGGVTGKSYDCTPGLGSESKDERKERDYPIYLTNDEWIRGITDRARSVADCGYKPSINGVYSDLDSEQIIAQIQKMSQKGNVKENITVQQIIWEGGAYVEGDLEPYETKLNIAPGDNGGASSCQSLNGACMTLEYCPEADRNTAGACATGSVCCIMNIE
ncbi:MAG: hypothetical protein ACP5NZ_05265 [Nanobdellota archaeon]